MMDEIRSELSRLDATDVRVTPDPEFDDEVDELIKIEIDQAFWHFLPQNFLELLRDLPDGAGAEKVHAAIEKHGQHVWHGQEPRGSRDV